MSRILITGANGFIGSHLVRKLLELKEEHQWEEEIVCMVRSTSDISSLKGLDVKLIIGDLRDPESLIPAVKGAAYIYHLGAELFTISRKRYFESITVGTENLLKAAVQHARNSLKRFLFVSTQAAAGPATDKTPITEERTPPPPVSWYAETKLEAEKISKQYMSELPITIVRPCSVYGERDLVIYQIYQWVKMRIHGLTGFRKRYTGMVYVKDVVEGMIAAAQHKDSIGETYFLANPENYSVNQVNKTLAKAMGKPWGLTIPVPLFIFWIMALFAELFYLFLRNTPIPTRDKVHDISQVYWLCTPAKAGKHFGWEAKHSLLEGMKATCDYIKEEERLLKKMPLEPRGILWVKYFFLSLVFGAVIEALAAFGKLYYFKPWWIVLIIVPLFWGGIFATLCKVTRTCHCVVQFLVGFILLSGLEILNHSSPGLWAFYNDSLCGITDPVLRAVVLGIGTGILVIIINACMGQFYKRKLRLG